MLVPMVDIRDVGMGMRQWLMPMGMYMRFLAIPRKVMLVLVVCVVRMLVRMDHRNMGVHVFMLFSQVQPDASRHQRASNPKPGAWRIAQHDEGNSGPHERRDRKIGAGPGSAEVAQGQHKEDQAQAISAEAHDPGKKCAARRRHRHPEGKRDGEIHHAGDQALDACDLYGVTGRYFARQVVVDSPAQAGADNRNRSPWHAQFRPLFP